MGEWRNLRMLARSQLPRTSAFKTHFLLAFLQQIGPGTGRAGNRPVVRSSSYGWICSGSWDRIYISDFGRNLALNDFGLNVGTP